MSPWFTSSVRSLARSARARLGQALHDYRGYRLNSLPQGRFEFETTDRTPRINLVITTISARSFFGGNATALRLLTALEPYFEQSRIIITAETEGEFRQAAWPDWRLEGQMPSARRTVVHLPSTKLVVRPGDRFIATFWPTALLISSLRADAQRSGLDLGPAAYLIQDFEPAFYPWGSNYALAESTYRQNKDLIAVFNTSILRDYFEKKSYVFSSCYEFEPKFNSKLATYLKSVKPGPKKKLILVYGRPRVPRNGFELVLEGLFIWARNFPGASEWRIISLGQTHKAISIAPGIVMRSKGKLTLDEYGSYLSDAAIGLSLMISPHPSYPPLEMAEFSVRVITNDFANKNLSKRSPYITSLAIVTPEAIAEALTKLCQDYEREKPQKTFEAAGVFPSEIEEFPFAGRLAEDLLRDRARSA
jgi:O-antigen biosynthesis protein